MTDAEKLDLLKTLLEISGTDKDALLTAHLDVAKREILSCLYLAVGAIPEDVTDVPALYEMTQVEAAKKMYQTGGIDGQLSHSEGGISRSYKYATPKDYIHHEVMSYVGVV